MPTKVKAGGKIVTVGPSPEVRKVAADYKATAGIGGEHPTTYEPLNSDRGKALADAYIKMKHNPNDPKVKAAYDAFKQETMAQYGAMKAPWIHRR
jgi:hypothetical protein